MASSISNNRSAVLALVIAPAIAHADPLRLRGDAFASAQAPAGLMTLEASDRATPWFDAEAAVWFGSGDDTQANALVMVVKLRDPKRRGALRIGRQVVIAGALRPIHVDGAYTMLRLPHGASLEAFGGMPVVPNWGPRSWDWLVGGRGAQAIGKGSVGIAWLEQRDHGELSTHELAADGSFPIGERVDIAAGTAIDLINLGLAEAKASVAIRRDAIRFELFGTHRAPSHLLPATSLFSVLGDVPATRTGVTTRWRAAPRLDVDATAALRVASTLDADGSKHGIGVDEDLAAGTRLRLDDRGASSVGLELRRQGSPDGGWTGARGAGRLALSDAWATSAELELAIPDDSHGRGTVWPWALAAITWRANAWELACATEASSTPQYRSRVDVLFRLSRRWDIADSPTSSKLVRRAARPTLAGGTR